jgi:hypothetical protein
MIKLNISILTLILAILIIGRLNEEEIMTTKHNANFKEIAMQFAKLLANRNYSDAYEMTTQEYRKRNSLEQIQEHFEAIIPMDWGAIDSIEAGETMNDWRGKEATDVGWVYVSLGGDVYSEAVTVIIAEEEGALKVREVEFGRP